MPCQATGPPACCLQVLGLQLSEPQGALFSLCWLLFLFFPRLPGLASSTPQRKAIPFAALGPPNPSHLVLTFPELAHTSNGFLASRTSASFSLEFSQITPIRLSVLSFLAYFFWLLLLMWYPKAYSKMGKFHRSRPDSM